jgi:hypothetical protein
MEGGAGSRLVIQVGPTGEVDPSSSTSVAGVELLTVRVGLYGATSCESMVGARYDRSEMPPNWARIGQWRA